MSRVVKVPWDTPQGVYSNRGPAVKTAFTLWGVEFVVEPMNAASGIHTGRQRYRVVCVPCNELHRATTGPKSRIAAHLREVHGFEGRVLYQDEEEQTKDWRTRYYELDCAPSEQWPEEKVNYTKADLAVNYADLELRIVNTILGNAIWDAFFWWVQMRPGYYLQFAKRSSFADGRYW